MVFAAAGVVLLVCGTSLCCSALVAAKKLLSGRVSIEELCDLFDGEWVWEACPFLKVGFCCSKNGRPDDSIALVPLPLRSPQVGCFLFFDQFLLLPLIYYHACINSIVGLGWLSLEV
uniref:Leucine-rich repeat-containing N-terminal plant-type domain-containing protein n=1 Tax=Oryza nivara TaxID=4536 RepID=A0A0E0IKR1_ORYNI